MTDDFPIYLERPKNDIFTNEFQCSSIGPFNNNSPPESHVVIEFSTCVVYDAFLKTDSSLRCIIVLVFVHTANSADFLSHIGLSSQVFLTVTVYVIFTEAL